MREDVSALFFSKAIWISVAFLIILTIFNFSCFDLCKHSQARSLSSIEANNVILFIFYKGQSSLWINDNFSRLGKCYF